MLLLTRATPSVVVTLIKPPLNACHRCRPVCQSACAILTLAKQWPIAYMSTCQNQTQGDHRRLKAKWNVAKHAGMNEAEAGYTSKSVEVGQRQAETQIIGDTATGWTFKQCSSLFTLFFTKQELEELKSIVHYLQHKHKYSAAVGCRGIRWEAPLLSFRGYTLWVSTVHVGGLCRRPCKTKHKAT